MKIRTDFVTNSSSSNFCVTVSIEGKSGNRYSLFDNPYFYDPDNGGEAYFKGGLKNALNGSFDSRLADVISRDFKLDYDRTNESVENIKVGAKVKLKLKKYREVIYCCDKMLEVVIEAIGENGLLGTFSPRFDGEIIAQAIKGRKYDVEGVVTSITLPPKRKNNKGKSAVSIRVIADKKDKTENEKCRLLDFDSVRELCDFLTSSVDDNSYSYDGNDIYNYRDFMDGEEAGCTEDEVDDDEHRDYMDEEKAYFTKEVTKNIKNISDIKRISVIREYNAWGEYADCISNNDVKLCEHANKVTNTTGEEHKEALKNMLDYINTSNGERGQRFGCGFNDFRYNWEGGYKELEKLAERLMSNSGPGCEDGTEFSEIDLETGKYTEYAVFNLY